MIPFYIVPKLTVDQMRAADFKITQALESGQITNGKYVREFEEQIKQLHDVDHVIACSSCTQGLWIALETLKPESLMVQAFTWQSIKYILPLRPVTYCDIDRETWLMNTRTRTYWDFLPKTVIYTHTFGNMGIALALSEDQKVIYDGAYSLGAHLPEIGDATVLSTTASKTITSCEGGLILTNDKQLASEMKDIRDKCSRMSELNAIVGLAHLENLQAILKRKKEIFEFYGREVPFKPQKTSPYGTNYGFYGCLVPNRDELLKKLEGKVDARIRYEPLKKGMPVTDEIGEHILILPCYHDVDEKAVVSIIRESVS